MTNVNNQISRMKAMMTYGLQTENKNNSYKSIEHMKEGADGKMYAIIREGAKFYMKVSDKKNNLVKEDFNYIGGFRNRKDHEYSSYANALKNFDMKMISIKESCGKNNIIIESWNPDKKEELTVEATEKMRKEIARQRQIMGNAKLIQEKKNYTVDLTEGSCCKIDKECADTQKNNISKTKSAKGDQNGNGGDPFTEKVDSEQCKTQKGNLKKECKPVMYDTGVTKTVKESEQVLGWNDNEDYLDMSHGTEVGDTAPFTEGEGTEKEMENGTVQEGVAMHNTDNQNSPSVGVAEVGDDDPFTEKAKNELQEDEDFGDDDVESDDMEDMEMDDMEETEEDDVDFGDEFDTEDSEEEVDFESELDEPVKDEGFNGDFEARLTAIEEMLAKIAEKMGVDAFEDDSLYDEDEMSDSDDALGAEDNLPMDEIDADAEGEEMMDDEFGDEEFESEEDDVEVFESRNYRKMMMKEDRMDYFGKHPAYQKEPMRVPSNKHQEMQDYYDMNDETVENERPFGQQIGSSAPFEVSIEKIENAIAESIRNIMKKKI